MNLLILGGGIFLGRTTLNAALAGGHRVSVFNRGRARTDWPAGVEVLHGDRAVDLSALAGRRWDAVIDTCGYVPADLRLSTTALRNCGAYLFVSSIAVYASTAHAPVLETDAVLSSDGIAEDDRDLVHYGPQKVACERVVQAAFGDARTLIVRPGLIVGPDDRSGRFSHWPWRIASGSRTLVPDIADGEPLQFIDVRDLGAWMVRLLEQGARGIYNATGPLNETPAASLVDWSALIDCCAAAARDRGLPVADVVRAPEALLSSQGVEPWTELPLWLPSADPDSVGFNRVDLKRARAAGLRTRPLHETVSAVLDEGVPADRDDRRLKGKLSRKKEAAILEMLQAPS